MKAFTIRSIGVLNVTMGLAGLALTAWDLTTGHMQLLQTYPVVFPALLLSCFALLGSLLVSGILMLRYSKGRFRWVLWLYALEIIYFIVTASMPTGGAFAVGNVGLFPQLINGFPIWGFIAVWWACRQATTEGNTGEGS